MLPSRLAIPCLLAALAALVSPAAAEPRIALVLANSDYIHVPPLVNPVNDAALVAASLEALDFDVELILNADRDATIAAIEKFGADLRAAGDDAIGLFFYAGHGAQDNGSNFIIPTDADLTPASDLSLVAVDAAAVLDQLSSAPNAVNIVILDACRNNPFDPDLEQGLAEMNAPTGTFVSYSTAPGSLALDGQGDNSPYSSALATAITAPNRSLEEIFREVRVRVLAATYGLQTPWDSSSLTSEVVLNREAAPEPDLPVAAAPQTVPNSAEEVLAFVSAHDLNTVAAYEDFLAAFPESSLAVAASAEMDALRAQANPPRPPAAGDNATRVSDSLPPGQDSAARQSQMASPRGEDGIPLTYLNRIELQGRLASLGFDLGEVDGLVGPATRAAISEWQTARGFDGTGFISAEQAVVLADETKGSYLRWLGGRDNARQTEWRPSYPHYLVEVAVEQCNRRLRQGFNTAVAVALETGLGFCTYGDTSVQSMRRDAVQRCTAWRDAHVPARLRLGDRCTLLTAQGEVLRPNILERLRSDQRIPIEYLIVDDSTGQRLEGRGFGILGRLLSFGTAELRIEDRDGNIICSGAENISDIGFTQHLRCGDIRFSVAGNGFATPFSFFRFEGRYISITDQAARIGPVYVSISTRVPESAEVLTLSESELEF